MLREKMRRFWARVRFTLDKIPHQIIHYTLGNGPVRLTILALLKPFPRLKHFLRNWVAGIQQAFFKKRILYQRRIHPNMALHQKFQRHPIAAADLTQVPKASPTLSEIRSRIRRELP